jgi:ABC-2 type transport system ATP-binding protein
MSEEKPEHAIKIDKLLVRFGGKIAVDSLSLKVPFGSVMALLGDNGAGKSTTMKVLTGQLSPDRGSAQILGYDTWSYAATLRSKVGYVPDRPKLYDWMSVPEIGWFTSGFYPRGYYENYQEWVRRLRLDPSKRLKDLSKGGYARVGLALALAGEPEVLLLDEPTSGLDLLTRREFLGNLVDLASEGRTILISSHSIAELERAASHAAFVKDGKVILVSTLDELRNRFRRISMRCDGLPPDGRLLGTCHEVQRTGKFVQYLIQNPDSKAIQSLRDTPGVTDLEDISVNLEDVYAAIMGHAPEEEVRAESREEVLS